MQLPLIPQDKANHFCYGAVIFTAAFIIATFTGIPPLLTAQVACAAAAVGKELSDYVLNQIAIKKGLPPPHSVELLDAMATIAPATLFTLVLHFVG